jgi:hypothetical protein
MVKSSPSEIPTEWGTGALDSVSHSLGFITQLSNKFSGYEYKQRYP